MPTIITVVGSARARHPAERGTVGLTIGFDGPEREDVVERTNRTHEQLGAELARMDAGRLSRWSSEQLRVWGARPWSAEGTQLPVVFHAAVSLSARFRDLAELSRWTGEVSLRDGVTVDGVEWALSERTRAALTERVQREAVAAAVAKAAVYSDAIGLRSLTPVEIGDAALFETPPVRPMAMMADRSGGQQGIELRPDEVTVEASVHARFEAAEGRAR